MFYSGIRTKQVWKDQANVGVHSNACDVFPQVFSIRVFSGFQAHRWKSMTSRTVLNEVCTEYITVIDFYRFSMFVY